MTLPYLDPKDIAAISETKFTRGPWRVGADVPPGIDASVNDQSGMSLARIRRTPGRVQMAANAHLIAAAPELYEALKEQVDECFDELCEMCARHEAILAKARGAS